MKKIMLPLLLILCLAVFAGCGRRSRDEVTSAYVPIVTEETSAIETSTAKKETTSEKKTKNEAELEAAEGILETDETVQPETAPAEIPASLIELRSLISSHGNIGAAAYIDTGVFEDRDDLQFRLREKGYTELYDFVKTIDEDHVVITEGFEAYLIVPVSPECTLSINRWDEANGAGEVLYRSESGEPVLLVCNVSGIPETIVNIVYKDRVCTYFPMIDREQGALLVPNDGSLMDISIVRPAADTNTNTNTNNTNTNTDAGITSDNNTANSAAADSNDVNNPTTANADSSSMDAIVNEMMKFPDFADRVNSGAEWQYNGTVVLEDKLCHVFETGTITDNVFNAEHVYAIDENFNKIYEHDFVNDIWYILRDNS